MYTFMLSLNLKTCHVKMADTKEHTVGLHLHELFRTGKSIETGSQQLILKNKKSSWGGGWGGVESFSYGQRTCLVVCPN